MRLNEKTGIVDQLEESTQHRLAAEAGLADARVRLDDFLASPEATSADSASVIARLEAEIEEHRTAVELHRVNALMTLDAINYSKAHSGSLPAGEGYPS